MFKKTLIIMTFLVGFSFSQDFEMPGLGVYVGGVMSTIGGQAADDWDEIGGEVGYSMSGPMLGVSYATMAGNFPLFVGAGLGARSGLLTAEGMDDTTVCFQYLDMRVTMPYPINDNTNLYGGLLFGKALSGSRTEGDADAVDMEDEELPTGMDMGIVFGLGYGLPIMDGALGLNLGYVYGLAELENDVPNDDTKWNHSGFFMTLNYDIPGM